MRMLKWKLFLTFLFILTACGQTEMNEDESISVDSDINNSASIEEVGVDEDLSAYPIGVQNGDVTPEFYDVMTQFNKEYVDFINGAYNFKGKPQKLEKDRKQAMLDFVVYVNSIELNPSTEAEKEIETYLSSMMYHAEQEANYALEYLSKKESVYNTLREDNRKSVAKDLDIVAEITKKYKVHD